jgi:hypothetical protein
LCVAEDNNNPFLGFFTGMMSQFMRESMANGSLPAFVGNTAGTATLPTPLPTLPLPPVIPYSSSRSQPIALPAAPAGHPLPSRNLSGFSATQPMLGMGGLGIPLSNHSNNPRRRRRVQDLSPTQISETNATRRAAAREHLGPTGAALQLRLNRRVRGAAVRGSVLNEAPGTLLEQVSSADAAGVRQIKLTVMVQAYQARLLFSCIFRLLTPL